MDSRYDRVELKYFLTRAQKERIMEELLPHLRFDENAGTGAHYPIVSLYYDSTDRDCYWDNVIGSGSRRKLRVRLYGSQDGAIAPTCFVEVKHKVENRHVKRRALLPLEHALAVAAGEEIALPLGPADLRIVREIHKLVHDRHMAPCCCVRYDRHAYLGVDPAWDLRVTFDTGIAYRFAPLTLAPDDRNFSTYLYEEGAAVMEVKTTGVVPYWLSKTLGRLGCCLQSHSKYCRSLEAGDPMLRRPLLPASPAPLTA